LSYDGIEQIKKELLKILKDLTAELSVIIVAHKISTTAFGRKPLE